MILKIKIVIKIKIKMKIKLKTEIETQIEIDIEMKAKIEIEMKLKTKIKIIVFMKVETHVISSIVHIAHKYDNDSVPWPLQIEDHFGRMHNVVLKVGEVNCNSFYILSFLFLNFFLFCLHITI